MVESRPKLWTKDFLIVSSVNFFLTLIFYLLVVTIAVYAVDEYQASASQAGLVTGIFIIGTLIGRLYIGNKIERLGLKKTMVIGLILFSITTLLYFVHFGITFLMINRFIHGVTLGMASTAAGTIVAKVIPIRRRGEGIGYYSMSATLATAIGPFIGLFMSQHTTFEVIFSFCFVLCVLCLLVALIINIPEATGNSKEDTKSKGFQLSNYVEPKALPIAFVLLIVSLSYSSVLSFINFYAMEIDQVEAASFFFVVYAIAVLISRPISGRLMDVKGANIIMYPAFIILGAGLLLLGTVHSGWALLLAGGLIGLGFGNMQSVSQAVAVKLTAPHRMGLATSTYYIFLDAGLGFGPYLLGFLIPLTGYSTLYGIMSIVAVLALIPYYFLHGKKERKEVAQFKTSASI
jgi:MFS family permease